MFDRRPKPSMPSTPADALGGSVPSRPEPPINTAGRGVRSSGIRRSHHPDLLSTQVMMRAQGSIHVAVPEFFEHLFVMRFLSSFMLRFKDISVELSAVDRNLDKFPENVDIVIRLEEDGLGQSMSCTRLGDLKQGVYAHKDFVLKHGVPDTPHKLALNKAISIHINEHELWKLEDHQGQNVMLKPKSRLTISNYETAMKCVNQGIGVALLPKILFESCPHHDVLELLEDFPAEPMPVYAITKEIESLPLQVRTFIDHMQKIELRAAE